MISLVGSSSVESEDQRQLEAPGYDERRGPGTLEVGKAVGGYRVVRSLRTGELGPIALVCDERTGRALEMSLLPPDLTATAEGQARFERDARRLAAIDHANVHRCLDHGLLADGTPFLVSEHLTGETLRERVERLGPLEEDEALEIFIGVCHGLQAAHRANLLHRNLSTTAIQLARSDDAPVAKVTDFGLALSSDPELFARLAGESTYLRRCAYAPPEELDLTAAGPSFTGRLDIYALGVVITEAMTGRNPFASGQFDRIVEAKLRSPLPTPGDASAALRRVLEAMLSVDPSQSPRRFELVVRALTAIDLAARANASTAKQIRSPTIEVGCQIGEYTLESLIGEGGMGRVFRARHRLLGVVRAIKVIRPRWSREGGFRDRFLREAQLLAQLEHANLVRVHDVAPVGKDAYYMVQELVVGESLKARLKRRGVLPAAEIGPLLVAAARGLAATHDAGIVHRDVSPDNIMIVTDEDGTESVKIIDFGIAKVPLDARAPDKTSTFVGKIEFCSPEQAGRLHDDETIDGRSDIYSLGCVLYRALTGRLPLRAESAKAYLVKHRTTTPRRPSERGISVSPALENLLMAMLAKDRAERPATMHEVANRLERCLGISPRARRRPPPSPVLTMLLTLVTLLGVERLAEEDLLHPVALQRLVTFAASDVSPPPDAAADPIEVPRQADRATIGLLDVPSRERLAVELVRAVAAREPRVATLGITGATDASAFLASVGIAPCEGLWDDRSALTADDLHCIAPGGVDQRNGSPEIDLNVFAERVRQRLP